MLHIVEETSRSRWETLLERAPRPALQQSWAYGEAVRAQGPRARRFVVCDGRDPVALLQLAVRRFPLGLRVGLVIRGPAGLDGAVEGPPDPATVEAVRRAFGRGLLLWTPDDTEGLRGHERRRVMTGASTGFLDLCRPVAELEARLHGKWRNMLRRAREAKLVLREVAGGSLLQWLIETNERHRRRIGYRGPSPDFYRALAQASRPKRELLVLVACEGTEPVAGVWMQRHGRAATYLVGATTERGRALRAHHRLLFEAMLRLRERGVAVLDLGGIDTVGAPGVARFKLGTGCEVVTFAGTWLLPWFAPSRARTAPAASPTGPAAALTRDVPVPR
jgi:hypothetical protein